jgi:RimJ/RimL family protein N-acetyltransferase
MKSEDALSGPLQGERIYLRKVVPDDVNGAYHRWMNDPAANRFLESRFSPHSMETLREYVFQKQDDDRNAFFAIVLKPGPPPAGQTADNSTTSSKGTCRLGNT